jgi:hypothetical protein
VGLGVSGDGCGCGRSAGMTGPLGYGGVWVGYTVCYGFFRRSPCRGLFFFLSHESLSLVDLLFLISTVTLVLSECSPVVCTVFFDSYE